MDDKEISKIFKDILKLQTNPVAVKIIKDNNKDSCSSLRYKINICQMVAMARYHGKVTTQDASGMICALGASCLGLIKTPERLSSGKAFAGRYVKDEQAGKKFISNVYKLGDQGKQFNLVSIGPLGDIEDPSVLVFYVNPGQILPLIHANIFDTGEKVYADTVAEGALCEAIGYSIKEKKARIGFPCAGDRRFGSTQKDELIFTISYSEMPRILENLLELKKLGVSVYPVAPNVMWTPSMPEAYTIQEEDINCK
jgi:uncharacterized protein (DUF169 family)